MNTTVKKRDSNFSDNESLKFQNWHQIIIRDLKSRYKRVLVLLRLLENVGKSQGYMAKTCYLQTIQ